MLINKILGAFDIRISRASRANHWHMSSALQRLEQSGTLVSSIIDIGAASGTWSLMSSRHFPNANLLAIEPLQESYSLLKRSIAVLPNANACQCVVGAADYIKLDYVVSDDLDGSGVGLQNGSNRSILCRTLDSLVSEYKLQAPFLLKLDTHGYELPILEGASNSLSGCSAVIIEAYNFKISPSACFFWELCGFMHDHGFRPIDIVDPSPRRLDNAFWQVDIVFVPTRSPQFKSNIYA